jgi:hypothetical protein
MQNITKFEKTQVLKFGTYPLIARNQRFRAIFKKMKETYRMWQIVRHFKKIELLIVGWDEIKIQREPNDKLELPDYVQKLTNVLMQTRDPRTHRSSLAQHFGIDRYTKKYPMTKEFMKKFGAMEQKEKDKYNNLTRKFIEDAQLRIGSCIDAGYIKEDSEDSRDIYLPLKGKKFATVSGLINAWGDDISSILGSWRVAIIAITGTSAVFNLDWIINKIIVITCKIYPVLNWCSNI